MILEYIEDLQHIRTWDDIKKVFGGHVEEYPGVDNNPQSGQSGRVWKIKGKELALKITTDLEEMKISKGLVGKNNKGFLNIYKAVEVPPHSYNGRKVPKLMLKVQEFCYPIKELERLFHKDIVKILFDDIIINFDSEYKNILTFKEFLLLLRKKIEPGYIYEPPERFLTVITGAQDFFPFSKPHIEKLIVDIDTQREIIPLLLKFINLLNRVKEDTFGNNIFASGDRFYKRGKSLQDFYELDVHSGNIMQTKEGIWKLVDF